MNNTMDKTHLYFLGNCLYKNREQQKTVKSQKKKKTMIIIFRTNPVLKGKSI